MGMKQFLKDNGNQRKKFLGKMIIHHTYTTFGFGVSTTLGW
jgi:hypothetical protein